MSVSEPHPSIAGFSNYLGMRGRGRRLQDMREENMEKATTVFDQLLSTLNDQQTTIEQFANERAAELMQLSSVEEDEEALNALQNALRTLKESIVSNRHSLDQMRDQLTEQAPLKQNTLRSLSQYEESLRQTTLPPELSKLASRVSTYIERNTQ